MRCFPVEFARAVLRYHDLPGQIDCPLVFIHGLGCASSSDYYQVAMEPALSNRRRLLVDLLGAGFSDRPPDFPYTVGSHAHCLAEFIGGLGTAQVDLFGHSAGGAIAIEAAVLSRGRVRRLILSEPNLDPGGGVFSCRIATETEQNFVACGHARMVRETLEDGNSAWAGSLAASLPVAVHRMAVSLVAGSVPSWREQLTSLEIPRTVIFGERSLPTPEVESLNGSPIGVRIVREAGHSMATENPAGLATVIRSLLQD